MDWIVRLPSALYRLSVKKAGTDRELQAHIREYLERWTTERTPPAETRAVYAMPGGGSAKDILYIGGGGGASSAASLGADRYTVVPNLVFCPDCQQVHAPGPCA